MCSSTCSCWVQVARDAGFKSVVHENKAAKATTTVVPNLTLGHLYKLSLKFAEYVSPLML